MHDVAARPLLRGGGREHGHGQQRLPACEAAGPRVYLRLDGAIDGLDAIRNLPVAAGDRSLKLGDIAEVKRGYEDPKVFEIRNDGEPALMLGLAACATTTAGVAQATPLTTARRRTPVLSEPCSW